MCSRRGRLNWSNIEVHISDKDIEKQHQFINSNSFSSTSASTSTENMIEEEKETNLSSSSAVAPPPVKKSWMPKKGVGEIEAEHFFGNFMLTTAEQTAIDKRYNKKTNNIECSNDVLSSKQIRISNRLPTMRDTPISIRTTDLSVGQHLLNVFVCHVENFAHVYIMFGDDYNRATKLFQEMNSCVELIRPSTVIFEPKEKDLVALYHEKKWFRGRCLNAIGTDVNVLCIDSGVTITCSRNSTYISLEKYESSSFTRYVSFVYDSDSFYLFFFYYWFRSCPPCCIECSLSGLPGAIAMNSIPDKNLTESFDLLYKDRYEAIVTRLESPNHPTIVLYYGNENVNDRLLTILKLI